MISELLYKGIVLTLLFSFFLGKLGRNSEEWEFPIGVILENKVICQGDRLRLHCANSSMGLTFHSALYGRTEPGHVICPYQGAENDHNYNCGERDVTEKLKAMCDNKSKCKVKVHRALFGDPLDPCPDKHLYLNLVYACELQKRKPNVILLYTSSSTVTKATSTSMSTSSSLMTSSWTTSIVSFSSIAIFPTVNITATSSAVVLTQSTLGTQDPPTVHTTSTEPKDSGGDNTLQVEQAGSTGKTDVGSFGIAGTLLVWFLFMQDHSSDLITVFFATAAGAISLTVIVGFYVLYRHHENKQHLHVKEEPRLSAYGTTEAKPSEEVGPYLLGPVKTPPPDYTLDGYNWNRAGSLPHKNPPHGSLSRTSLSAKDVGSTNAHNRYC